MTDFTLDDFDRMLRSLPPDPVAPENRGYSRLRPSAFCQRGVMYRLSPQPELTGHTRPLIVLNTEDLKALRALWTPAFGNIDQQIADAAEQLFAEQEARTR